MHCQPFDLNLQLIPELEPDCCEDENYGFPDCWVVSFVVPHEYFGKV